MDSQAIDDMSGTSRNVSTDQIGSRSQTSESCSVLTHGRIIQNSSKSKKVVSSVVDKPNVTGSIQTEPALVQRQTLRIIGIDVKTKNLRDCSFLC